VGNYSFVHLIFVYASQSLVVAEKESDVLVRVVNTIPVVASVEIIKSHVSVVDTFVDLITVVAAYDSTHDGKKNQSYYYIVGTVRVVECDYVALVFEYDDDALVFARFARVVGVECFERFARVVEVECFARVVGVALVFARVVGVGWVALVFARVVGV
jgi:hypothetical protein